jgi:hypothetical protein
MNIGIIVECNNEGLSCYGWQGELAKKKQGLFKLT